MTAARELVEAFIEAVNQADVGLLKDLMAADHRLIDPQGRSVEGREEVAVAWTDFFKMFPDYRIEVETLVHSESTVGVFGSTTATFRGKRGLVPENRLGGPAAWKALVKNGQIQSWQVYADWTEAWKVIQADQASDQDKE
ncbi:MAG TPA: nuclear transport factor 2 family protein [Acidobacteriota bacterium]|nr:nuclear transport factor 2 family protein [Acidobacteriota bacterium]